MDENRIFNNWDRALLVSLQLSNRSSLEVLSSLEELSSLAYSLGGEVAGQIIQSRTQIHPAYFFGKGKLAEIKDKIRNDEVDAVLVDQNDPVGLSFAVQAVTDNDSLRQELISSGYRLFRDVFGSLDSSQIPRLMVRSGVV